MAKFDMTQLEKAETVPAGSLHLIEMGAGSGTKAVTQETLIKETGKAAGAAAVKAMFGALNDNINGNILTYNESEDAYYIQHGADAVPKKLGSKGTIQCFEAPVVSSGKAGNHAFTFDLSSVYDNYQSITADDIVGGIKNVGVSTQLGRNGGGRFEQITSYDPKTGIINATVYISSGTNNITVNVTPCFYIVT